MKKKLLFWLAVILVIVRRLVEWWLFSRNTSTSQPSPAPNTELSEQKLEKYLLEKRLELKKYFVFNLGELTKQKVKLPNQTWVNGRVVNSLLERHLSVLSSSHKEGKKRIIVFVDRESLGASEEWMDEKLDEKIDKKQDWVVFEKNSRVEYNFFPFGKDTVTNVIFLEAKVSFTIVYASKEKALVIIKIDPALQGRV
ncbi:MAG: hypothetical protein MRERC_1c135 [Mycoplasmataceae bacterium RC_NB112A]|nr:MAG: hypothetical protein MRERC_1c135 [Mycoplasmataceae bacterium RC_NB112A]